MASSLPITVLGGYLGAGKTTLLNRVLAGADGRRIGVVVNDFGDLGVDAALLADQAGDGLVDLPNGCVCCTLGTELGETLDRLAARRPELDQVIIEASGVADPAALAAWGTVPGFAAGGVFVVAAADSIRQQVDDRYVGGEVRRQLAAADVVIVTKVDLVDADRLEALVEWLPSVTDAPVEVGSVDTDRLLSGVLPATAPGAAAGRSVAAGHAATYSIWTWTPVASTTGHDTGVDAIDVDRIRRFVESLPGWVLRAKGIVPLGEAGVVVQVVGRRRELTTTAGSTGAVGIEVIGPAAAFDADELDRLAAEHLG